MRCADQANPPARVLLVTAAGERGGAEAAMEHMARRLTARRYTPILAAPAGSELLSSWERASFDTAAIPVVRRLRNPIDTARAIRSLADLVRQRDIRIIHTNGVAAQLHAGLAARRARQPVVSHVRDIFDASWTRNGLLHRLSLKVPRDATIAASNAVASSLRRADTDCDVIPDPVETTIVAPIERQGPLVLWCGRLQRWKGCHFFLRAARRVFDRRPDARFAVVGGSLFGLEPEYAAELRRQAVDLGIADRVEFAGQVSDARSWMRAADVFVHSSGRPEPFGMVMAEAMIQERPVVAFRHGAAAENVVDGETGRLVPPGDTEALASAICDLLADEPARRAMGLAARRRAVNLFAAEIVTRQVEAVYDRVLQRRGHVAEPAQAAHS